MIEKRKFHFSKYPLDMKNVDIDKIMISNKVSFSKKEVVNTLLVTKIMIQLSHCV